MDNVVKPWLLENFDLPDDLAVNPKFKTVMRVAAWATEKAKIELSAKEETVIMLSEDEMRCRDSSGNDIYLEIPLSRGRLDELIAERLGESIISARETISKAALSSHDLERIVFVGGPTNYEPLRDKVSFELGISGSTDVNPMTAVAEGASLFAESIDWSSESHSRKSTRGQISTGRGLALTFSYIARTPDTRAKISVQVAGDVAPNSEFQIDSCDTGTTSGRIPLTHNATVDVMLTKPGENLFKVFVFDSDGGPISMEQDKIVITRTAATVDAIPASHSIGFEALEKLNGKPELFYLVRAGDPLPKEGREVFMASESLKAGSLGSLNFKLWEGEIVDPISDNRAIGALKVSGSDFEEGVIPAGAKLECEYKVLDSGLINLQVSVECIGGTFGSGKNFYSRQESGRDYTADSQLVSAEGKEALDRLDMISEVVDDPRIESARKKLGSATSLKQGEAETEKVQEAEQGVKRAKELIAQIKKEHLKEFRQIDLDCVSDYFGEQVREYARPSEATAFDNLSKTAQRSIDRNDSDFEHHLTQLRIRNFDILWRQDWFVVERFKRMLDAPQNFADKNRFEELAATGKQQMQCDDIEQLRKIVYELWGIEISSGPSDETLNVNIIRG